jgi:hypothetical protein
MLSAAPSSGIVNSMIRITGIGDRNQPEWLIGISGIRKRGARWTSGGQSLQIVQDGLPQLKATA